MCAGTVAPPAVSRLDPDAQGMKKCKSGNEEAALQSIHQGKRGGASQRAWGEAVQGISVVAPLYEGLLLIL